MGPASLYGLAAATAFLWGANFNLAAPVLAEIAPMQAAAGRFVLAALVMAAITAGRGEAKAILTAIRTSGPRLALVGVVGVAGFNVLFFDALRTTSAVNGALMMATNPLATALLAAMILGERVPARQLMSMPLAVAGVAVVILGRDGGPATHGLSLGDLEMAGANLIWALYNVLMRKLNPPGPALANVTVIMAAGAVVLVLAALLEGRPLGMPGAGAATALVGMAVLGSALPYLFWNVAIAGLGAGRTALFLNLVPVCAAAIAALQGQMLTTAQLAGGLTVIAAVAYAMMPSRPRRPVALCEEMT